MQEVYLISSPLNPPDNTLHKALDCLWEGNRRLTGAGSPRYLEYNGLHLSYFCEQILQELTSGINQGVTLRVRSSNTKQQVLQLLTGS